VSADDVIRAWDKADPTAIHPLRNVSEDAYWDSGRGQADMLATVIPTGAKVLDFGCGDGRVAIPMAGLGYEVTAVDASQRMLDRMTNATADIANAHPDLALGITTVQATADGIAGHLGRRRMDAVYSLAVLIHHSYADCLHIIGKLRAATKLGGLLILDWPASDQPTEADSWIGVTTWSTQQQADACAAIGLEPVDSALPWGVYRAVKADS
jgi:2-polyprenyl-3-methyl-5-hydroxy-6-metoxy-1,4-benzoquinol methylase